MSEILKHLHPMLTHFPIALLVVSVALEFAGLRNAKWRESAWITLLLGTLAAIPTVLTGLIAHEPYEKTPVIGAITTHEQFALATFAMFIGLTFWRWRSRRANANQGSSPTYLLIAVVGLLLLFLTGYNGGKLVYDLGVGVTGV